ncbi:MAG TPA: phosphoenolpyruvate carboxylase [Steroidobacteraceae bacterium]|nr:phosphoenolpyruvate carboxylase [Steroidobacteraceae bacterium]
MKRTEIHFPPKHSALRDDVHALGELTGEMLREQGGADLLETVEADRVLAIRRREGDATAATDLQVRVRGRAPSQARDLVRAFSGWFQAVNLAEKVHRIRRRREYFLEQSARPQPGGVDDALRTLRARGCSLNEVLELVGSLRIEPVFAAHPTESTRRTILRQQQRVAQLLLDRLDPTLTPHESRALWSNIRTELTTRWQTEDHPREKLTVADEREHVLFYLREVLYRVVPDFYEEIADAIGRQYSVEPEVIELPAILSFGSWVGGDMDGNPDVHGKTVRETLARQQQVLLNAYFEECQGLAERLSQSASRTSVSAALSKRIEEYASLLPGARAMTPARHDRMPYRVFLAQISARLRNAFDGRANGYQNTAQLRADVQLIADSLRANRGWKAGYYSVQRLLRRIDTFGLHLAALDVRQHASVHHDVLQRGFDDAQWHSRSSAERHRLLAAAIERDLGPRGELDPVGRRVRGVFESIVQCRHRYGTAAIGYYIVSGADDTDDVLAALLLARWAEAYDKKSGEVVLDIAPHFSSIDSLERSGDIMRRLLDDRVYRKHLKARGDRQCVVVGHAESNKEGGLCAARLAAFDAERSLAQALSQAGERHLIFHARGGSVALGGGRIDAAVRGAPPQAVNGFLRLTQQGEVVSQSYGLRPIAMRTLERAFNALSLCTTTHGEAPADAPAPEHVAAATTLAAASRREYRRIVHGEPAFYEFFRCVTPIDVIELMQIGSRSASREGPPGVDALRPIPWVFAWTQSRHLLPGWLGAGAGLAAAVAEHGLECLRAAYAQWFFLRSLIDDVEAMMARADIEIARAYNALAPVALQRYFADIAAEHALAGQHVIAIKGYANLLDGDQTLQRSIQLRNPYVDPMNLMQIELLTRWRSGGRQDRDLFDALVASISGIAQGLQSSG